MSRKLSVVLMCGLAVLLGAASGRAADRGQAPQAAYAARGERTCLACHNMPPANFMLQTPHAVKSDARTPFAQHQCESCHGASPDHVAVSSNPVAVVYKGPLKSPVAERNRMCLSCHESGLRTHWTGSQHESRGVACTDCHNIHSTCLLYTSDAADDLLCVDLGG